MVLRCDCGGLLLAQPPCPPFPAGAGLAVCLSLSSLRSHGSSPLAVFNACLLCLPTVPGLQEQLDGDLLVFSPYPSLSAFLQDSRLAGSPKTCEAAW